MVPNRARHVPSYLLELLILATILCLHEAEALQRLSFLNPTRISSRSSNRKVCSQASVKDIASPDSSPAPVTSPVTCDFCKTAFLSRNALFRHLRSDGCTSESPTSPFTGNISDPVVKQSIAILFGYLIQDTNETTLSNLPLNEWAGQRVFQAVQECLCGEGEGKPSSDGGHKNNQFQIQPSRTQSSVARLRSRILQQDPDCAAAGDVLLVTVSCLESCLGNLEGAIKSLQKQVEEILLRGEESANSTIRIWSCKLLASDISLHAERSATQLTYRYLVPLEWLPDGELLKTQWTGWNQKPPTDSLRKFKAALRHAESSMVSSQQHDAKTGQEPKVAAGRFGRLGAKERRAWHSFADPALRGQASPNHEPVWRVVDACRMTGMAHSGTDDAALEVEVRGDAFLPQQVRRIIGTALAITHGWLTEDIWDRLLLKPDCIAETILAPPGRLYLAQVRFHFEESRTSGKLLFDTNACGNVVGLAQDENAIKWIQQRMLKNRSSQMVKRTEAQWLREVKGTVCPRIRKSLESYSQAFTSEAATMESLILCPKEYQVVLEKLRKIVASGQWPDTSVARSSVIQMPQSQIKPEANSGKAGSFTVVNMQRFEELNVGREVVDLPLGNQLFPDLTKAIFELEAAIADKTRKAEEHPDGYIMLSNDRSDRRPWSTHCAVNCNAQFTPHVDSGRGAGQSLSIIVGLGNYLRGELMVEGNAFDIRYSPLEFDGWTLRHWTNQFEGERFSLVWFSPEAK